MSWRVGSYIFFGVLAALSLSWDVSQSDEAPVFQGDEQSQELFFSSPEGPIPWPLYCAVQQTGKIITNLDCYGRIGVKNLECRLLGWPEGSFVTPAGSGVDYLWAGGIWVAGKLNNEIRLSSSSGIFGDNFSPAGGMPAVEEIDYISNQTLRAVFADTTSIPNQGRRYPLYIEITNRSHVFYGNPFNKTIIYDLVITNIGDTLIEDAYFGLYFDADIGYYNDTSYVFSTWLDDLVGSFPERGLAYAIDNDGDPVGNTYTAANPTRCFAVKLLTTSFTARDTSFNWWADSRYNGGWSPSHKDPAICDHDLGELYTLSAEDLYCLMGLSDWDYDQVLTPAITADDPTWQQFDPSIATVISRGSDIKFLLSVGPFDLAPDSSARVLFATLTGELIHTNTSNWRDNLLKNYRPNVFNDNLNFWDLFTVANASEYLADSLLNPSRPPIGLRVTSQGFDSVVVQWDPWVFDEVQGYEVYLSEVSPEILPYPGVPAPWMKAPVMTPYASIDRIHSIALTDLQPNRIYYFNIAHRTPEGIGSASKTIFPISRPHFQAPRIESSVTVSPDSEAVTISWEEFSDEDIDYSKIFQIDRLADTVNLYHPFYDRGAASVLGITPKDSFCFDEGCYYYYAMTEHARVDSGVFSFSEFAEEGKVYIVAGVNKMGFESHFSAPVRVLHIDPPTEDILVVTNTYPTFVSFETIANFYDSVFADAGSSYRYNMFNVNDTARKYGTVDSIDWHDFAAYRMLIFDDDLPDESLERFQILTEGLSKYMLSGGSVIYCGSFNGPASTNLQTREIVYQPTQSFVREFFPVDSIYFIGPGYYILANLPIEDTDFGCNRVEDSRGVLPNIGFDSLRYPFGSDVLPMFWSGTSIPGPVGFKAPATAEPIYRYRTHFPGSSIIENRTAAIRFKTETYDNYLFGFHLWYMNPVEVRAMIEAILAPTDCCLAVGDIDRSGGEVPTDISDAIWLVKFLYADWPAPYCPDEADINGDGSVDLVDLSILVDFLFRYGPPMPVCE